MVAHLSEHTAAYELCSVKCKSNCESCTNLNLCTLALINGHAVQHDGLWSGAKMRRMPVTTLVVLSKYF